ncbi:hypothetical protein Y032_0002g1021 [Ancylostoma ceylanicum]|uniref:Uncharacterized protein n=1 Tax=Ancylostoma ceylanicum TaxID=53326 RepID=A0A016VZ25_9BILA|nr:hypothetical protein Y032_0002g1021 [Ancylostoma ceylanicum]
MNTIGAEKCKGCPPEPFNAQVLKKEPGHARAARLRRGVRLDRLPSCIAISFDCTRPDFSASSCVILSS